MLRRTPGSTSSGLSCRGGHRVPVSRHIELRLSLLAYLEVVGHLATAGGLDVLEGQVSLRGQEQHPMIITSESPSISCQAPRALEARQQLLTCMMPTLSMGTKTGPSSGLSPPCR